MDNDVVKEIRQGSVSLKTTKHQKNLLTEIQGVKVLAHGMKPEIAVEFLLEILDTLADTITSKKV